MIGRFDRQSNQFQCISVRLATSDEKAHAMKFVQAYSKSLQKFDMSKNEYWTLLFVQEWVLRFIVYKYIDVESFSPEGEKF